MADGNSTTDTNELKPEVALAIVLPIVVAGFLLLLVVGKLRMWILERREEKALVLAVNAPRPVRNEVKDTYNYDWTLQNFEDEERKEREERQHMLAFCACTCPWIWRSSKVHPLVVDTVQVP